MRLLTGDIDEIRSLRDQVRLTPTEARYKVYIIDEVHMLTAEAFNAFLKTLEEPPPRGGIYSATTEPERIPASQSCPAVSGLTFIA